MMDFSRRAFLATAGTSSAAIGVSSATGGGTVRSDVVQPTSTPTGSPISTFTATTDRIRAGIDVADPTTADGTYDVSDGITVANATVDFFTFDGEILDNGRWRATSEIAFDLTNFVVGADLLGKLQTSLRDLDTDIQNLVGAQPTGEAALSDLLELVFDPSQISEEVEVIGAIFFGAIAEVDGFTLTTERDFTIEDIARLGVSFINRFDLDETQADAIFRLLSLYEPAILLLDNEFLYNPTIDNVTTIITAIDLVAPVEINTFDDFSRVFASIIQNNLDTTQSTTLEALATRIGQDRPGVYDSLTTTYALYLVPDNPQTGDWDPRAGSVPQMGLDMSSVTLAPKVLQSTAGTSVGTAVATQLPQFEHAVEAHLTTGQSGALSGSASVDESAGTATASVVENEFTLALHTLDFASEVERLYDPANLAASIEASVDDTGDVDVEQTVREVDIVSIVAAFDLERDIRNAIQDEPGRHVLEFDFSFTGLDTGADLTGGGDLLPDQLPSGRDVPRDLDNDGLFEDTAGTGTFDIFDVQTLFLDHKSQTAATDAWAYNFSNKDPDPDTGDIPDPGIFDVQALFNQLLS